MTMFGQPKPLASLSSGLLARKGMARPAMRPQGLGGFGSPANAVDLGQDDLGWNDMGDAEPAAPEPAPDTVPPVLRQREALHEEFETPAPPAPVAAVPEPAIEARPVSLATARRIGRETQAKNARAAFTLRLDHDRHLRLRLASALNHASAQLLVTEALDRFLQSLPEVEELARQLPPRVAR